MSWDSEKAAYRQRLRKKVFNPSGAAAADAQPASSIKSARTQADAQPPALSAPQTQTAKTPVQFGPFYKGLNTDMPAAMIDQHELAECTNFAITPSGMLRSRYGLKTEVSAGTKGYPLQIVDVYIPEWSGASNGWTTLVADSDYVYAWDYETDYVIPVYYAGARSRIVPFGNKAIFFRSGRYPVTWDGTMDETGSDMVTNGDMSVPASWTAGTGWTISGGSASVSGGASGVLSQDISPTDYKIYKVEYTVSGWSDAVGGGYVFCSIGSSGETWCRGRRRSANGAYTEYVACADTDGLLRFKVSGTPSFDLTDVEVHEIDNGITLLYDDGTGPGGYLYKINGQAFSYTPLYNGSYRIAATKFTTPDWGSGITLAPTFMAAYMRRNGNNGYPNDLNGAEVKFTIRLATSPYTVMAEATLTDNAYRHIAFGEFQKYELFFESAHVTTELSGNTDYYACVELESGTGSATERLDVQFEITDEELDLVYSDGSTYTEAVSTTCHSIYVKPGMAPKAEFGVVNGNRLYLYEGEDGDNPSYVWYSANNNPYDWSTPFVGGYDDLGNPIGTLSSYYKTLWVFGTKQRPYLHRLDGTNPSEWKYSPIVNWVYGYDWSICDTPRGPFFLQREGLFSLDAVETYKDVAMSSQAPNVSESIMTGWDSYNDLASYDRASVCYSPTERAVWFRVGAYVFVSFLDVLASASFGEASRPYSPVSSYEFNTLHSDDLFCYGIRNGKISIGGYASIGYGQSYLYSMTDFTNYDEANEFSISFTAKTAIFSTRFGSCRSIAMSPRFYTDFNDRQFLTVCVFLNYSTLRYAYETFYANVVSDYDEWESGESYTAATSLVLGRDGDIYSCSQNHTSETSNEPGFGENWRSYWTLTYEYQKDRDFSVGRFRAVQLSVSLSDALPSGMGPSYIGEIVLLCENIGGF